MKILFLLVVVLGTALAHPRPIEPTLRFHARRQNDVRLGDLVQEFSLDLSDTLWQSDNVVFSPLSISSLLSLLMAGSAGTTNSQLRTALHYLPSIKENDIHTEYGKLTQKLNQQDENVIVNMATRLFLATGSNILSNFTDIASNNYGATVRNLQFNQDPLGAMNSVNQWVNQETRGKIPQLITQPFKRNTNFVAANTVYFNGAWQHPFNTQLTQDGTFNTGSSNITVPMMRTTMNIPYINMRELNADMIALPYKGYRYGMFLVKPKGPVEEKTLQEVEFALDAPTLNRYISEMTNSTRNIVLPRMKLEYKSYMKDALKNLGVRALFNSANADFSKITANDHVWVDDMIHQTVVEVTETGTEAAAASSVSLNRIGTSNIFEVNRPSLFFIRHMESGLPLFWGRIMRPIPLNNSNR